MADHNFDEELKQLNLGNTKSWIPANNIPSDMLHTKGGFDASVWMKGNKAVIVMDGSSAANLHQIKRDWVLNDGRILVNELPPEFYAAQKLLTKVRSLYPNKDISVTGLSIGSDLAGLLVAANPGLKGVGFSTVGGGTIIKNYSSSLFKHPISKNMKNYIIDTDWLANIRKNDIFGQTYILPGPKEKPNNFFGINLSAINPAEQFNYHLYKSHVMDAYKNVDLSKAKQYIRTSTKAEIIPSQYQSNSTTQQGNNYGSGGGSGWPHNSVEHVYDPANNRGRALTGEIKFNEDSGLPSNLVNHKTLWDLSSSYTDFDYKQQGSLITTRIGYNTSDNFSIGAYGKIPDSPESIQLQNGKLITSSPQGKLSSSYTLKEDSPSSNSNNYRQNIIQPNYQQAADTIGNSVVDFLNKPSWSGVAEIAINVSVPIAIGFIFFGW